MRELRVDARKIQAGSLQLPSIIKEAGGTSVETKVPQETKEKMTELEKENKNLKKCIEELKEQMRTVKEMYTNDDCEDRRRIIKMEKEIDELKEEKRKMKIEMEEMRVERDRKIRQTKENKKTKKESG